MVARAGVRRTGSLAAVVISLIALNRQKGNDDRTGELGAKQAQIAARLLEIEEARRADETVGRGKADVTVTCRRTPHWYLFTLVNNGEAPAYPVDAGVTLVSKPDADLDRFMDSNNVLPVPELAPGGDEYRFQLGESLTFAQPFDVTESWCDAAHPEGTTRTVRVTP